ncbi:unnamed protein product [Euphydryas editha]|uniref:Uncharacterized protein n=1 Tax=Euphydryas editha TaxID=104508 RepID=A0AAU9TE57_EUPED|nr:unnamed protein product [Euphydryas editha]
MTWQISIDFPKLFSNLLNLGMEELEANPVDLSRGTGGAILDIVAATLSAARCAARGAAKLGEHAAMLAVAICCILVLLLVFIILIIVVGQNMEVKGGS